MFLAAKQYGVGARGRWHAYRDEPVALCSGLRLDPEPEPTVFAALASDRKPCSSCAAIIRQGGIQ